MHGSVCASVEFWWGLCELVGLCGRVTVGGVCAGCGVFWHRKCFEIFWCGLRVGGSTGICVNFSLLTAPGLLLFQNLY